MSVSRLDDEALNVQTTTVTTRLLPDNTFETGNRTTTKAKRHRPKDAKGVPEDNTPVANEDARDATELMSVDGSSYYNAMSTDGSIYLRRTEVMSLGSSYMQRTEAMSVDGSSSYNAMSVDGSSYRHRTNYAETRDDTGGNHRARFDQGGGCQPIQRWIEEENDPYVQREGCIGGATFSVVNMVGALENYQGPFSKGTLLWEAKELIDEWRNTDEGREYIAEHGDVCHRSEDL